jgi:Flp pilus assembly protein TadB
MSRGEPSKDPAAQSGLAALAVAAFAMLCCAAVPVLAALAGSLAIGVVLGVGAGLAAAVLLTVALVARMRRRRTGRRGGFR